MSVGATCVRVGFDAGADRTAVAAAPPASTVAAMENEPRAAESPDYQVPAEGSGWWVSWYSPFGLNEFEMHSPWWCSGYADDGNPIIVAAVRAADENRVRGIVAAAYDSPPDDVRWRFIEPLGDRSPFSDRFPQAGWMAWDANTTCRCEAHSG